MRLASRDFEGNRQGGDYLRRARATWKDNFRVSLKEISWRAWAGFICLWIGGQVVGFCGHDNEILDSIKCGEFMTEGIVLFQGGLWCFGLFGRSDGLSVSRSQEFHL
jgi:hypothetical protein